MIALGRTTCLAFISLAALGVSAIALQGCGQRPNQTHTAAGAPVVRVRIFENQQRVTLTATQSPTASLGRDPRPQRLDLPANTPVTVEMTSDGWRFGNITLAPGEVTLVGTEDGSLAVNRQHYRGRFRFVPVTAGKFDVVNDLDIDGYLRGVLPKELLWNWDIETYKAQAICARTYALYEWKMIGAAKHFDLNADERSQVYGGMDVETAKSRQAVDETSSVVLAAGEPGQERIFKAYFSSCCGGVHQSNSDVFGEVPNPALAAQKVGNLCSASPKFNWGPIAVRKDELTRRFRLWGSRRGRPERDIALITRVDVQTTNEFGRPTRFVITDARGLRYSLSGEEIRWAINTDSPKETAVNSSFFKPVNEDSTIQFVEGHGWGHGVGMCQWCAQAQALQGQRHENIVLSGFPGAVLVRAY